MKHDSTTFSPLYRP